MRQSLNRVWKDGKVETQMDKEGQKNMRNEFSVIVSRVLSKSNPLILWTTHLSKILDIYKTPSPYYSWPKGRYGRHRRRISVAGKMKLNRNSRKYPSWAGQQQTHLLFHIHLKNYIRSIKFSCLWQKTPNNSGLNKQKKYLLCKRTLETPSIYYSVRLLIFHGSRWNHNF